MSKRSRWHSLSLVWKVVLGFFAVLGGVASALQIFRKVDFWNFLILPVINFFVIPIPLYSVPLAFIIVIVILLIIASMSGSKTVSPSSIFDKADILDNDYVRYIVVLCKTPQTTDFLKQKYQEFWKRYDIRRGYSFEDCLKQLEYRELLVFQDERWIVTQKALDYIAKYHG